MKHAGSTECPRKHSRASEDAEDAAIASSGKKTRGRPRVETQDATAGDRRKTQIRHAQRAYRQRKETTICSLKHQCTQLNAIIKELNKTFMGYNDLIVQSGLLQLNPALARDVKQITEYFANCVRLSQERTLHSDEGDIGSEGTSAQQSRTGTSVNSEGHIQRSTTTPEQEQTWNLTVWSQSPGPKSARAIATQSESYLAHISRTSYSLPEPSNQSIAIRQYSYSVAELQDQSRSGDVNQLRPSDDQDQQGDSLPFSFIDDPSHGQSSVAPPNVLPVDLPAIGAEFLPGRQRSQRSHYLPETPVISRTLSPKYTYSYKDVTFAQTLLRATVEVGFRLLYNPAVHPAVLNYVFRLSLPYLSLEDLRKRSKTSLFPGATEEQDWNATPFLHLGGAGTHYQRLDAQGMLIPMENSWTVRQIGPLERNTIRTENVTDGRIQDLEGVDIGGFEGKWFDSYDVQGYLEERWHCRINPKSSFAECLIDDEDTSHSHGSTECASLNLESTATNPNYATPPGPVPQAFNAFEPSSGLDMPVRIALASTFLPPPPKHNLLGLSFDQTLGLDLAPDVDLGFVGSSGFNLAGLNTMGEAEQLPVVKQKAKRVALVDVQKLIDKISQGAVCLGRSPGYRRKDVDAAFREAIITPDRAKDEHRIKENCCGDVGAMAVAF